MAGILDVFQLLLYPTHYYVLLVCRVRGTSGGLHEIGEAISLSLKSRSFCYFGLLALSKISTHRTRTYFFKMGMAAPARLELAVFGVTDRYFNQLNYGAKGEG